MRNTCLAIVSTLFDALGQGLSLGAILLIYLILIARIFPWRVYLSNIVDIAGHVGLLVVVSLAPEFIDVMDHYSSSAIRFCFAVSALCFVTLALGISTCRHFCRRESHSSFSMSSQSRSWRFCALIARGLQ